MNLDNFLTEFQKWDGIVLAIATISYASLTYFLLREQQKERQRPRYQEMANITLLPLIKKLTTQVRKLKEDDFGWRENLGYGSDLENIKPLFPKILDDEIILNYEDFQGSQNLFKKWIYPRLFKKIRRHDNLLQNFQKSIDEWAHKIESLTNFKKEVREKLGEFINGRPYLKDQEYYKDTNQNLKNLLSYTINNGNTISVIFPVQDFLKKYKEKLLSFRNKPEIKENKVEVERIKEELINLSEEIRNLLIDEIERWRKKYGIRYKP